MVFTELVKKSQDVIAENSAVLLTAVGVVGTVTTAALAGKASYKAAEVIMQEEVRLSIEATDSIDTMANIKLPNKEKLFLVWPLFVPAVGTGITTVTAIIFANRVSASKSAAMAAAYTVSEKGFQDYKDKVTEKLGMKKSKEIKDELSQEKVDRTSEAGARIVIIGDGEVLCYDEWSDRYFTSTMETLKQAENKINYEIVHHIGASLGSFYNEIGLASPEYAETMGWNSDNMLELHLSTTMATGNRPCISVGFNNTPVLNYGNLY